MLLVFPLQHWMGDGEHCWLATEIPQAERHAVRQSGGKASSMKDKLRRIYFPDVTPAAIRGINLAPRRRSVLTSDVKRGASGGDSGVRT